MDLNRNYDSEFGQDDIGSSGKPCGVAYRGPKAFSEPETRAVRDFITKFRQELALVLNFHS